MFPFIATVKHFLKRHKFIATLNGVSLCLTLYDQFSNKLSKVFNSRLNVSILILLLSILSFLFVKYLESNHSRVKRSHFVKIYKYIGFIFWILPLYWLFNAFATEKSYAESCNINNNKTNILIASFSTIANVDDGFSSNLFGKLNSRLQRVDTIRLKELKTYISEVGDDYLSNVRKTFQNNCAKKGLLIFGNRKNDKQFNCRIYSLNFLKFSPHSIQTDDKAIIYIQNPDIIDFSIENESAVMSKFIIGLLYYHQGAFDLSEKFIKQALALNNNDDNQQFISVCHLFIGNAYSMKKQYSKAISEYKKGLNMDEANPELHYNIALIYNVIGATDSAQTEYETAKIYNPKLTPIFFKSDSSGSKRNNLDFKIANRQPANVDSTKALPIEKVNWFEECRLIEDGKKYGVLNNRGDTIIPCKFDAIRGYRYKDADVYLIRLNKKYGAVIHVHTVEGYKIHKIPVEFSYYTIDKALDNCLSNAAYE